MEVVEEEEEEEVEVAVEVAARLTWRSSGTACVMPQSNITSLPSFERRRLPGWGSQWSTPVSRSIVRYALIATPHSRGTSGLASRSSRVPSTHSVTNTLRLESSGTTFGAVTAPNPRRSIAAEKASVFAASYW